LLGKKRNQFIIFFFPDLTLININSTGSTAFDKLSAPIASKSRLMDYLIIDNCLNEFNVIHGMTKHVIPGGCGPYRE